MTEDEGVLFPTDGLRDNPAAHRIAAQFKHCRALQNPTWAWQWEEGSGLRHNHLCILQNVGPKHKDLATGIQIFLCSKHCSQHLQHPILFQDPDILFSSSLNQHCQDMILCPSLTACPQEKVVLYPSNCSELIFLLWIKVPLFKRAEKRTYFFFPHHFRIQIFIITLFCYTQRYPTG